MRKINVSAIVLSAVCLCMSIMAFAMTKSSYTNTDPVTNLKANHLPEIVVTPDLVYYE